MQVRPKSRLFIVVVEASDTLVYLPVQAHADAFSAAVAAALTAVSAISADAALAAPRSPLAAAPVPAAAGHPAGARGL